MSITRVQKISQWQHLLWTGDLSLAATQDIRHKIESLRAAIMREAINTLTATAEEGYRPDLERKHPGVVMRVNSARLSKAADELADLRAWDRLVACRDAEGEVAVCVWSRDCDMCESDRVHHIPCRWDAWEEFCDWNYESAEGPMTIRPMRPEDAAGFESSFRDRVAEAWDNGNVAPFVV